MRKLYTWGDMGEKEYRKESLALQKRESQLIKQIQNTSSKVDIVVIKEMLNNIKQSWNLLTFEQQRHGIHILIDQIIINKHNTVEIVDMTVN